MLDGKAFGFSAVAFVVFYVVALIGVFGIAETRALFWRFR